MTQSVPVLEGTHQFWAAQPAPGEKDKWLVAAANVAGELAHDVLERDAANKEPFTEVELLRKYELTNLIIPAEFGGGGATFSTAFEVVRTISQVDGSIAQLLAYHYINVSAVAQIADEENAARLLRKISAEKAVVGDAVNPTDPNLTIRHDNGSLFVNGTKRFATGSGVGNYILIVGAVANGPDSEKALAVLLEREQQGVKLHGDWDALGQRLSSSGSVTFDNVQVREEQIVGFQTDQAWHSLIAPVIQQAFVNFYIGVAEGALLQAKEIINNRNSSWFLAKAERYDQDHIFQRLTGELVARTKAASALARQVNVVLDGFLSKGTALTHEDRAELEIAVAEAKVVASDVATDVTHRVFEFTGSSSARREVGLDLHWRNVRTHSLHDPVDYKKIEVGAFFLRGELQPVTLYT